MAFSVECTDEFTKIVDYSNYTNGPKLHGNNLLGLKYTYEINTTENLKTTEKIQMA